MPVVFTVDDDFGIQSARLLYKVAIRRLGADPGECAPALGRARPACRRRPVKHQEVRHDWNLAPLKLTPGSIITFHAEARDFDNLKGPNLGKSRELRLRIVSDEDIARQLDDARREIREETARILAMQKQAAVPVEDALRTLAKDRPDRHAPNRDDLKNAEMIQRQVGSRINSRTDGLDQKIRRFLDDLKNFKIPNPDAQKQMEQMQAGVERIREQHLGPAEQGLTRASKSLDARAEDDAPRLAAGPARGDRPETRPPSQARPQGRRARAVSPRRTGARPTSKAEAGK